MDIKGFGGTEKRSINDPVDLTGCFSHADTSKNVGFLHPCFVRVLSASSVEAHFLSRTIRYDMSANSADVSFTHVLFGRNPFKVICSIVGLVPIYVMDVIRSWLFLKPADRNHPVKQAHLASAQISVFANFGCKGGQLSKNFPAPRNGVQVVEESVFDSFYFYAQQVSLLSMVGVFPEYTGKRKHG